MVEYGERVAEWRPCWKWEPGSGREKSGLMLHESILIQSCSTFSHSEEMIPRVDKVPGCMHHSGSSIGLSMERLR